MPIAYFISVHFLVTMWQYAEYVEDIDMENWPFSHDGLDGK